MLVAVVSTPKARAVQAHAVRPFRQRAEAGQKFMAPQVTATAGRVLTKDRFYSRQAAGNFIRAVKGSAVLR